VAIMRDPGVGAFGVFTVAVAVVLQATALASRAPNIGLVVALWCASRALIAAVPAIVPSARETGMASPLLEGARAWPAYAVVPAIVVAALTAGVGGAVAVL